MGRTYIIAEVGVNHNGDISIAKQLIKEAAEAGCDAVKFQTFKTEELVSSKASKASYQVENTGDSGSQATMLRQLELSEADFQLLKDYCGTCGIDFLSTPFDLTSVDVLERCDISRYKISSGDLTNKQLLQYVSRTGKPIILSTGMASLEEVAEAIEWIKSEGNSQISLLHCTSNYPTQYDDVNMKAMKTLAEEFEYPIGYSDHTIGIEIAVMAVSLGASIIEKHITLDNNLPGPDHCASLETRELGRLCSAIRHVEVAFGSSEKKQAAVEADTARVARKSLVAKNDIKAGQVIRDDDVCIKRPGDGIPPKYYEDIIGKIAVRDVEVDASIKWEDIVS